MTDTGITTDRLLTYAFGAAVIAIATGLAWSKLLTGAEWVTNATWVTAAVVLGRAAGVAASGFVISAQARADSTSKGQTS